MQEVGVKFARKRDGLGGIHTELRTFERRLRGILLGLRFFQGLREK